jgi:PAS domain S-box-containing protein
LPVSLCIASARQLAYEAAGKPKMSTPIPIRTAASGTGESPDIFRVLVESVRDYAIFVLDPEGRILTWNLGAQALKGYAKEEIIGKHFSKFYPPEAVASGWPERELELAEKEGRFADEGWRVKKDGTTFWASVIITALRSPSGVLTGFAKVTQDLTARRQTEEQLQTLNGELRNKVSELDEAKRIVELRTLELQKLSAEVLRVQDEERRRIARELHDDLGQKLVSAKMTMPKVAGTEESLQTIDEAIATVRNLSYLLHPPLLDETGLQAALHWFIEGLAKRSGIKTSMTITPQTFPRLARDVESTIFRVVQECLTNVYRHAKSENARVEIERQFNWIVVRIRDYGIGVPHTVTAPGLSPRMGVGISGMRERLRQFGGELTVSRAEPGTIVEGKIPLF